MAEERFVAAGIDISDDMTQIAFFITDMEEPQMVGDVSIENDFLIPTAIEKTDEGWIIGEACTNPVDNLFSKACYDIKQIVEDYDAVKLLAIYAENIVRYALMKIEEEKFDVITFALQKTDRAIIDAIRKHFFENGFGATKLEFITHAESSIHYVLNQKKELRVNDVAFFDLSKDSFIYRKLHMQNAGKNPAIEVSENDYTASCNYSGKTDDTFKDIAVSLFEKQQISTVYLIGEGFRDESWAHESLNYICNRRRVFKGRNLYALGACYKSIEGHDKYPCTKYCFLCKGRTSFETCMEVVFKEERNEAILLPAGELWYDVNVSVEGILYNTEKINFVIRGASGDVVKTEEILLNEFPYRQDRMTRVMVEVTMQNENEAKITVKDLGFGEFAASSGLQIIRNIQYQ